MGLRFLAICLCVATLVGCSDSTFVVNADVFGNSSDDVYVAGYTTGCGCKDKGFIRHYDGSRWTTSYETQDSYVWSVWSSGSEVFSASNRALLQLRNGKWRELPLNTDIAFFDIGGSSNDNVFVVGENGIIVSYLGGDSATVEQHGSANLYGVWVSPSTDAYAVGASGTVLHYDGETWSGMDSGTSEDLRAVWGSSSSDVYAVGGSEGDREYVIIHYDGASWTIVDHGGPYHLLGISGRSPSDITAVGGLSAGDSGSGVVLHFDGRSWREVAANARDFIWSVWVGPDGDYFMVGPDDMKIRAKR